jgi:hypothetical protein
VKPHCKRLARSQSYSPNVSLPTAGSHIGPLALGIHRELVERGILRPEECRLVLARISHTTNPRTAIRDLKRLADAVLAVLTSLGLRVVAQGEYSIDP